MSSVVEYEYTVCCSKSLSRAAKAYLKVLPPEVKTLCASGSSGVALAAAMMALAEQDLEMCYVPKPHEERHGGKRRPLPPCAFVDDFIEKGTTFKRVRKACKPVKLAYAITGTDKRRLIAKLLGKTKHIWPNEADL